MNKQLHTIITWGDYHQIDLDRATFNFDPYSWEKKEADCFITFHHTKESRAQFQAVKRAIGGFPANKNDPGSRPAKFERVIAYQGIKLKIVWDGAFECKVSYSCEFKDFEDDATDTDKDPASDPF